MFKAIYLIFFVSLGIFAADIDHQKELLKLSHNLKSIDSCFNPNGFNREKFNDLLTTDEIFKEEFQNENLQPVLEKINSGARITETDLYDALIDGWFDVQVVPFMTAGELPEDGHDIMSDFLTFAGELAKVLKLSDKTMLSPTDKEWSKFMIDSSNKDWVKGRTACPLLKRRCCIKAASSLLLREKYF